MKIAESWLREWVDPDLDTDALGHQLTMLGHEVDDISVEGARDWMALSLAEVVDVGKHPDADRLSVCQVSTGSGKSVEVVCGAPNVVKGMKSPFAKTGLTLPNGVTLKKAKIRGVTSNGHALLSNRVGSWRRIGRNYFDSRLTLRSAHRWLITWIFRTQSLIIDLTPNRGDCFSVLGIARDVSALTGAELKKLLTLKTLTLASTTAYPIELLEPAGCPVFAGRVIQGN